MAQHWFKIILFFSLVRHSLYFTVPNPSMTQTSIYFWLNQLMEDHCTLDSLSTHFIAHLCCRISAFHQPQPDLPFHTGRTKVLIKAFKGHFRFNWVFLHVSLCVPFTYQFYARIQQFPFPPSPATNHSLAPVAKKEGNTQWGGFCQGRRESFYSSLKVELLCIDRAFLFHANQITQVVLFGKEIIQSPRHQY